MCTVCFYFVFFLLEHRQTGLLKTTLYMGVCKYIIPLCTVSALYDTLGLKLTRFWRHTHLVPWWLSIHGYDTIRFCVNSIQACIDKQAMTYNAAIHGGDR
jgi:hypothetical protein